MAKIKHAPVALIIMDGCGLGGKLDKSNAVEAAKTPVLDGLMANYNTSHLQASGELGSRSHEHRCRPPRLPAAHAHHA